LRRYTLVLQPGTWAAGKLTTTTIPDSRYGEGGVWKRPRREAKTIRRSGKTRMEKSGKSYGSSIDSEDELLGFYDGLRKILTTLSLNSS